jgi:hypothetical protein
MFNLDVSGGNRITLQYANSLLEHGHSVTVLLHKGAKVAPWNLANYQVNQRGSQLWVEDQPLIFFHFHSLKQINEWLFNANLVHYKATLSSLVRRQIYDPYLQTLREVEDDIRALKLGERQPSLVRHLTEGPSQGIESFVGPVRKVVRGTRHLVKGLLARQYLPVVNRRAQKEGCERKDHSPKELMGRP